MPPPDSAHRDAARLQLDHNVVVEAGAGTGKTTLLTDRLLFLLLGRGVPVASLVALTFTEKAAGEIKVRLTERLDAFLRGKDPLPELQNVFKVPAEKAAERARAALEDMDKAQIATIHAFCSHLLRLYPIEAGVDPGLRVDEGDVLRDLFTAEWARFLDAELDEKSPRAGPWTALLRRAALEDLEELARRLCEDEALELDLLGRPDPGAAAVLRARAAALAQAAQGQPKPKGNSKIAESLDTVRARLEALADAAESPAVFVPGLDHVEPAVIKSTWPKAWAEDGAPVYEAALKLAQRASPVSEAVARSACALLVPFVTAFRETFARKGWVSFQGLLRKARDLVRDNPAVREQLKARYQTLLIDEFQDTDPLQGELLLFLAEKPGGGAGRWKDVKLGPGRLFVVGDPKQSIYRFRGADIAAYQDFTRHVLENGKSLACDLTANFRSHEGIIEPVNELMGAVMVYEPGSQPLYKPIAPQGTPEKDAFTVLRVDAKPEEKLKAADSQRTEAAFAAKWFSENCGEGKDWRFKDAAVLLRSTSALPALIEAFKSRGVPYAVEMERYFYGSAEVQDFLNLLRALDDPGDRLALAGLLRSPLTALEDAELLRLAEENELGYLRRPKTAPPRVAKLYETLRGLRSSVGRVPLGRLVEAALAETALLETCARAYHGQQTVANLLKFVRMASEASDQRGLTLKEFIARVAADMNASDREGEHPLADDHLDAVRVLTIHKAKGLEFPVVFVLNLSGKTGGASQKPVTLLDWSTGRVGLRAGPHWNAALALLLEREEARAADETLRLLYVALTRPKRRLFLLGASKPESSSLAAWLEKGKAWPPKDSLIAGTDVLETAGAVRELKPAHPLPPQAELDRLWTERGLRKAQAEAKKWTTSATAQRDLAGPPPALEESELSPAAPDADLIGQACHAVLERWNFSGDDLKKSVAAVCARLRVLRPLADWGNVERETAARLYSFLESAEARAIAKAEIVGREVPFVYAEGGTVVRGAIDLLLRENGKLVVVDYKTGRAKGYEKQGEVYRKAVEKAMGEPCTFRIAALGPSPVDA